MSKQVVPTLCIALAMLMTGCTERPVEREQADRVTPEPTVEHKPEAMPSASPDHTYVCQTLDDYALFFDIGAATAIAEAEDDVQLRREVAQAYADLTEGLIYTSEDASGELRNVVAEWAVAASKVGLFVAKNKPKAGLVLDYGPAYPRFRAARKDAEKICGHPLPDLG